MNVKADRPRLRFSLRQLLWLVAGVSVWLAIVHYWGQLGIIFTSPLVGGAFVLAGTAFRLRILTVLGAVLLVSGSFLLGIAAAILNP